MTKDQALVQYEQLGEHAPAKVLDPATQTVRESTVTNSKNLSPKTVQAVQLYATGQFKINEVAAQLGISPMTLKGAVTTVHGKHIIREIQMVEMVRFQGLFTRVVDVIEDGLEHHDKAVQLAAGGLWSRIQKDHLLAERAKGPEGELTAEELIQKLMSGEFDAEIAKRSS